MTVWTVQTASSLLVHPWGSLLVSTCSLLAHLTQHHTLLGSSKHRSQPSLLWSWQHFSPSLSSDLLKTLCPSSVNNKKQTHCNSKQLTSKFTLSIHLQYILNWRPWTGWDELQHTLAVCNKLPYNTVHVAYTILQCTHIHSVCTPFTIYTGLHPTPRSVGGTQLTNRWSAVNQHSTSTVPWTYIKYTITNTAQD